MDWYHQSIQEALDQQSVRLSQGLAEEDARARLENYGPNCLDAPPKEGWFRRFLAQFNDFMVLLLLAAAGISLAVSWLTGDGDYLDPIIILAIVVLNALLGLIQESRAEHALEALSRMSEPHAFVRREGTVREIPACEVAPGDILILHSGAHISADARLVQSASLMVQEAALTGESAPVQKEAGCVLPTGTALADQRNMVFSGTSVVMGHGEAVVVATGMDTQVGAIAHSLLQNTAPATPLQRRLAHTGKILGLGAIAICGVIFCLGLLQHTEPLEMFMTSVSLAVAAIPEGLPAIVTIVLALGVQRMAGKNAIVRHLPAVETLGNTTVICSDKTGTLTQNRMTVVEVSSPLASLSSEDPMVRRILFHAALCCNISPQDLEGGQPSNPTEAALVQAAEKVGAAGLRALQQRYPRIAEYPFDSVRKRMCTLHRSQDGRLLSVVKGAPDKLLPLCRYYEDNGRPQPLTPEAAQAITQRLDHMGQDALRVMAVAVGAPAAPGSSAEALERDLTLLGMVGIMDPPRPEAAEAVARCRLAGIRPMMVTGDHRSTAGAIARQLGILGPGDGILTGEDLDALPPEALRRRLRTTAVCARVTPQHKMRIVKALQADGQVVAMTGDGVNDAPALQAADIGCAMGQSGTDVAKGASDMILTDDNFATIVEAVRQGRGIYANIRKAIHFLLSSNMGEILVIFMGTLLGWPSPLLAIQLLWVNLITDSLPAIALGMDPIDSGIMREKPVSPKAGLFSGGMGMDILWEGALIGALALFAFLLGYTQYDGGGTPLVARTMAFSVLSISQLLHTFNLRSRHSLFSRRVPPNAALLGAVGLCVGLQVAVVALPPLAGIFRVVPLTLAQWGIVAGLAIVPILAVELEKALFRRQSSAA